MPLSGGPPIDAGTVTIEASDIQIGAVEIKNSTDDTRATVGADGLYVEVRKSALSTGAATEAKQDTGNTSVSNIDTNIGAKADSSATTDTGTFSLVALFKRLLVKTPALGAAVTASSTPVNIASDQTVPVSAATLPLPSGAATAGNQTTANTSLGNIDTKTPALGQALAAASTPVVLTAAQITTLTPPAAITGFATETTLGTRLSETDFDTKTGGLTESAPATDTASSGLNGRLQRIAQRLTSLIALLPTSLGQKAKSTSLAVTLASDEDLLTNLGGVTETAPASDTASSGLNGRLQRIAQRLTSLIALLPASLGQKAMASSLAVTVASDQSAIPASQSGAWSFTQAGVASGGLSISRKLSAANTTGISAKGSAGQVYGWAIYNTNASARYVKIYNKATAPTVGTDTPVITLLVPGNSTGAGSNIALGVGIALGTGVGYGITTGVADNDTGAPAANEVIVNFFYF